MRVCLVAAEHGPAPRSSGCRRWATARAWPLLLGCCSFTCRRSQPSGKEAGGGGGSGCGEVVQRMREQHWASTMPKGSVAKGAVEALCTRTRQPLWTTMHGSWSHCCGAGGPNLRHMRLRHAGCDPTRSGHTTHTPLPAPHPPRLYCRLMDPDGPNLRRMYLPGLDALKVELACFDFLLIAKQPELQQHLHVSGAPRALRWRQGCGGGSAAGGGGGTGLWQGCRVGFEPQGGGLAGGCPVEATWPWGRGRARAHPRGRVRLRCRCCRHSHRTSI